jgi:hypothetical protein
MNLKKFFIAFVAAWVWIFVFGWVYHGMLMHNTYAAMPNLMRAPAEVQFQLIVLGQIVMAFFFTLIFVRGFGSGGGVAGGFRYGILLALFLCGLDVIDYAVEPLTTTVLFAWCVGGIVELAMAGVIVGALYKPSSSGGV